MQIRVSRVLLAGWERMRRYPLPPVHATYLQAQALVLPLVLVLALALVLPLAQGPPQGPPLLPLLAPPLQLHDMQRVTGEREGGERVNGSGRDGRERY